MKFSITWTLEKRKFAPLPLTGDIEAGFNTAREIGCNALELSLKTIDDAPAGKVLALMDKYDIEISAIATGLSFGEEGIGFCCEDPELRQEAEKRFKQFIDFAGIINSKVIFGLIRGDYSSDLATREQQIQWSLESLKRCAELADKAGVEITVEPINRYETRFINTIDEADAFVDRVGSKNLTILADLFHMNIEEANMEKSLESHRDKVAYLHIVDSNRQFPGRGHINLESIIKTLNIINYKGFLTMECIPVSNPQKEASEAIKHISAFL